ncbi:MAG TPA: penicillin acylase family protein [Steroidobacteraceae bacterium]|nr:penicillin acylase family protein [Steroidobacteraceae bacterium]
MRRTAPSAVALAAAALAAAGAAAAAPAAPPGETIAVAGLHAPADILIDRWGVPHIYARSETDLYLAQGWNAARDRLFQIDLWRRRGLGQLAEVFGRGYVEDDRAARLFLYRGDLGAEWAAYGGDARAAAERFVAGINAYVDWLQLHPERLPREFRLQNYRPAHWTAADLVRIRAHGLSRNLDSEVARAQAACRGELAADRVRAPLAPPWQPELPAGLDPCLPRDVLRLFTLATRDFRLEATPGPARSAGTESAAGEALEGSNNWAVAPAKSATGRAILANDPHRAFVQPSIRYLVGLDAPTLHAIGANQPQIPGISLGHNDAVAFGYTIFPVDQEDLYVYDLDPASGHGYRYRGHFEPFRTVHETIAVRDGAPVPVDLEFSRHGPVIYVEAARHRAFAVRSAWFEPGTSVYFGALAYLKARSLGEFERALDRWRAPSLNHLYADSRGTIAWLPAGLAPRRPNWDGLLPVPGDGRYEWRGFWRRSELPRRVNPKEGYLSTSNEMNLPDGYPYADRKLGFEWTAPWRHLRIDAVLAALPKVSLEDSERLQTDQLSLPAQRIALALRELRTDDADARAALALLAHWDGAVTGDSAAAALYETWFTRHLRIAARNALLDPGVAAGVEGAHVDVVVDLIEHPQAWLAEHARERRDALVVATLGAAYRELLTHLGADPSRWRWDALHYNLSEHPFAAVVDAAERARLNVGPFPTGGDPYVPSQASYRAADFRDLSGPSVRVVIDVGNWDASVAVNHPGQSGDPDDPHYRDLAELWRRGEYFPLLFSRAAVERATERTLRLVPAR